MILRHTRHARAAAHVHPFGKTPSQQHSNRAKHTADARTKTWPFHFSLRIYIGECSPPGNSYRSPRANKFAGAELICVCQFSSDDQAQLYFEWVQGNLNLNSLLCEMVEWSLFEMCAGKLNSCSTAVLQYWTPKSSKCILP